MVLTLSACAMKELINIFLVGNCTKGTFPFKNIVNQDDEGFAT